VRADVMRVTVNAQVPWTNSSLTGDVYLAGAPAFAPALDDVVWESLKGTTDVAALRGFAARYPGSRHRDEAVAQITLLESRVAEDRRKTEEEHKQLPAPPPAMTPAPTPSTTTASVVGDCNRLAAASLVQIDAAHAVPACRAGLETRPNDPTITFQLGRALAFVGRNEADEEAVRLLREASGNGVVGAASTLGFMHQHGLGGLRADEREAVRLYKLAAVQRDSRGQSNLGAMYQNGLGGLAKDARAAVKLYKLAAAQGWAGAQFNLAAMYQNGLGGLAKDARAAVKLYKLAAEQGDARAQTNLGFMYLYGDGGALAKDEREALRLLKSAANQGEALAQINLGVMHEHGYGGLAKDEREAVRLYELAAEQGNALGQVYLGFMYQHGRGGLAPDKIEASRLVNLAGKTLDFRQLFAGLLHTSDAAEMAALALATTPIATSR
jgi:TPR repeat protein